MARTVVTDVLGSFSNGVDKFRESLVGTVIIGTLLRIRSSFLNFTIAVGIILMVIGVIRWEGVVAAMLVVVGASAIIFGLIGYLCLKLIGYI